MKKKKNLMWLFFLPLTVFCIILIPMSTLAISGYISENKIRHFLTEMLPMILFFSTLAVFTYYFVIEKLNKILPWKKNLILRGLVDFLLVIGMTSLIMWFMHYAFGSDTFVQRFIALKEFDAPVEGMFALPLIENILFVVAIEAIEVINERNELELNLERMEKAQLQTKYSALKNQLDNHFLFNNLSVLSSLIYEDIEKSDQFIQEFAKVYRYVLTISEDVLVPVEQELDFIDAYLFLLKIRFEEGLIIKNELDNDIPEKLIPPLSLQVLIENAIKHNQISKRNPLEIRVYQENDQIIVSNNYQLRDAKEIESTHTGLKNLTEKYKLISDLTPRFGVKEDQYIAELPLINQ
ncbi:histidine kinase [Flammeovirga yaeyamensis]|uniref:Histidine kinase n=1 Tax=Flammeovirga yaeyamensis TaxID=367791 RepID=A0AAX1N3S9_9BACT|nr:histidine kinase [Flammeovirga yaeyamensis]MBB3699722.1 sensor histidine kinase YesM [Flammeovirga yaeyamensis]NMF36708.1 histidine kinase [Flammeovirga yaeyamensis]QWG02248.1 histidine kinase [Flammeovirga yaeyamensis]